jgi:hypothetical protein
MFSRSYSKQGFMKPTMEVVLNARNWNFIEAALKLFYVELTMLDVKAAHCLMVDIMPET